MRYAMAIDLNRCIGCRTCAVVCKNHNAEPEGIWWNRVFATGAPAYGTSVETDEGPRMEFTPVSCQQCDNPPCQTACPTGATFTDDTGTVLVDYERCIGCRYCMTACPYNVRQFNWQKPPALPGTDGPYAYGYPLEVRQDGRLVYTPTRPDGVVEKCTFCVQYTSQGLEPACCTACPAGYPLEVRQDGRLVYTPTRPDGVVEKCTFCVQYTSQGLEPACCTACPANARIFGDADDPDSAFSRYVADKQTYVLGEEYGTRPKVVYIPSQREAEGGDR